MRPEYIVGLDLGQTSDYTAVAVLERTLDGERNRYAVSHLERFALGTSYTAIADRMDELVRTPPLLDCTIAVDQTGVGRAVVDLLRARDMPASLKRITITGGQAVTKEPGGICHVPKKDLVGVLQVLLQARRINVARGLRHARTLVRELENFRVKITEAAHETFGVWRDGQHDDLVLAVALAAWVGETFFLSAWDPTPHPASLNAMANIPKGVFLTGDGLDIDWSAIGL